MNSLSTFSRKKTAKTLHVTVAALSLGAFVSSVAAQNEPTATNSSPARMEEVLVEGREESLVGIADSATQGTVGAKQLEQRTLSRPAEVLETVPGVIITQHSGSGKANQYFMRGFNLDHGTDFATSVNGMGVNMPTHGHGQGYTDLNFLIPELVHTLNYKKGNYFAEEGDFSSAGAANISYYNRLPNTIARVEGGSFGYLRGLYASSPEVGPGNVLYALEAMHSDGPWKNPDDFQKFNGVLGWSQGDEAQGYSVTLMGYHGTWDATDQIPFRALSTGLDRFGGINDTSGGDSQRYSLSGEWHRRDDESATKIMAYGLYYDLHLWSDFTYFAGSPMGDQFEQLDERWVTGFKASHTWFNDWSGRALENTVGVQIRSDNIHNGLFQTVARARVNKPSYPDTNGVVSVIPGTTREDDVFENSVGVYFENKVQWAEKFRTTLGVRGDFYNFDVESNVPANSGTENDFIASPKLGVVLGPWADTEFYLNGGLGFHSNDGRGTTSTVDPVDPTIAVTPADPLVRTYGAEVGVRTTWVPQLHSSLSLWWLDIDSELLFVGDAGTVSATRPSRRYGIELANYYTPVKWMTIDADFSLSKAQFRDFDPAGDEIPGSIETVVAAGITFHDLNGFFGGLRLRYFGPRPLVEDDSVRSGETILMSAQVGYQFNKNWEISAEVFNLLNRKDSEIDYFYESQLSTEGAPVSDVHFHPVEPISFRVALTARF